MYNCIGIPEKYVSVSAVHNYGSGRGAVSAETEAVLIDSAGGVSLFFFQI